MYLAPSTNCFNINKFIQIPLRKGDNPCSKVLSRHTDGSPGAQPPRSQLVVYGTSPDFPFPLPFILNAIDTDDVIIINDITLITLLLTILMAT